MNGNLIVGVIFLLLGIFIFVASMGANRPFAGVITMVIGVTRIIRGLSG